LIRVVVRRFAPRKQRMLSAAPLSRARSVRDNNQLTILNTTFQTHLQGKIACSAIQAPPVNPLGR